MLGMTTFAAVPDPSVRGDGSSTAKGAQGVEMRWFPEFVTAVELARRQTRAAGQADPAGQYFAALNAGDRG
jgi:hypothetical protein